MGKSLTHTKLCRNRHLSLRVHYSTFGNLNRTRGLATLQWWLQPLVQQGNHEIVSVVSLIRKDIKARSGRRE